MITKFGRVSGHGIDYFRILFLEQAEQVDTLGALNGQTKSTVPYQLGKRTQCAAHTECDGVVQRLLESIVVEQDTRGSIHVRVGVLGL